MALLDVSEILNDPDLVDRFDVVRRMETVGTNGRSTTSSQTFKGIIGVVTASSPNDIDRQENYQAMPRIISVVTKFRLRSIVNNEQPDIVVWRGSNYLVRQIDQYPQFGNGFVQAECASMDKTDPALDPAAPGQMAFNQAANTVFSNLG